MDTAYSDKLREILSFSREEAIRLGNETITVDHFFLGLIRDGENIAVTVLGNLGIDVVKIKVKIESHLRQPAPLSPKQAESIPLLKTAEKVLKIINLEAKLTNSTEVNPEHLLYAIVKEQDSLTSKMLLENAIDYFKIKEQVKKTQINPKSELPFDDDDETEGKENNSSKQYNTGSKTASETPVLDNFGIDLTKAAEEGRLDQIVGREREIERIAQILSRRKKNNPILIGEPGVGKSAIAEGLAMRIIQKKVSRILFNKRVITLDLASIVAGTNYRGQFEDLKKAMLNDLARSRDFILFIDEIHTIVGECSASGSLDAANMLKPALARGEIQCIGATTLDEYRQHIEKDGALERRFQKVIIEPANVEEAITILNNIKNHYENHHNVKYTKEAIEACVRLTERYISDRHLPDKAIDALDEAGSRVHITNIKVPTHIIDLEHQIEDIKKKKVELVKNQNFELAASYRDKEKDLLKQVDEANKNWQTSISENKEPVTEEDVAAVVAMMTGIPVQRIAQAEVSRLLKMNQELRGSVIGQDEAIQKVVKAIQRNRAGLKDPNKPIGTFIFLGPTGVGKTQLAKVLAQYLFDSQDALIRVDMSEFMEKFAVSRLVGAPPGYVGYEEGGQLTEKVRRRPYSVVLLDEIEKAHPDVFNLLLQVLDEGRLTDSLGRKIDFKNTILIMTSNIGTREISEFGNSIGFSNKSSDDKLSDYTKQVIERSLKKAFAPEFLNRIDDIVQFKQLTKDDIYKIIDIELKGLYSRIEQLNYKIKLTDSAKEYIVERGYDAKFGARPLKRAIQKFLEDPMAEYMLSGEASPGDTIQVTYDKVKDEIKIKTQKKKEEPVE